VRSRAAISPAAADAKSASCTNTARRWAAIRGKSNCRSRHGWTMPPGGDRGDAAAARGSRGHAPGADVGLSV